MRSEPRKLLLARAGFTLVEVLVTLVLIALLIGVVLPSVINQLDRGEPTRITEDLESVRTATRLFRVDVRRWPGSLMQLVREPATWADSNDINGVPMPDGLMSRWAGPYLEVGALNDSSWLEIGVGALVDSAYTTQTWGSGDFIAVNVSNLTQTQAGAMSVIIDGNETLTDGRVRYAAGILTYLLSPLSN